MIPYARKQGLLRNLVFGNLYDAGLYQHFREGESLVLYHVAILLSAFRDGMYSASICTAISYYFFYGSVHTFGKIFKIEFLDTCCYMFGWFCFQLMYVTIPVYSFGSPLIVKRILQYLFLTSNTKKYGHLSLLFPSLILYRCSTCQDHKPPALLTITYRQ